MVRDAAQHRAEDQRLREMIDARNELDTVAYQVERRLGELADAAPVNEKARAEMLVADARQAIKEEAPLARLRSLTSELQQLYHGLNAPAAGSPGQRGPAGGPAGGPQPGGGDDDVIDAEFTTD